MLLVLFCVAHNILNCSVKPLQTTIITTDNMTILRNIVTATSILLVLLSTPTVVEGTCQCEEVCPNYNGEKSVGN